MMFGASLDGVGVGGHHDVDSSTSCRLDRPTLVVTGGTLFGSHVLSSVTFSALGSVATSALNCVE